MRTQRPLTEDEKAELNSLNAAVTAAIEKRRAWLDAKMYETSRLKVGDDIYDLHSGRRLGRVSELYRYHTDRNDLYDTSVHCDYKYETGRLCFDNTSRQPGLSFGTRQDAVAHAEAHLAQLRRNLAEQEKP